jgi:hypothetical protein
MSQSKHAVYGTAILRNGVPIAWLQFESGKLTHKEAEQAVLKTVRSTLPADVMWANPIPAGDMPCVACKNANISED